LKKYKYQKKKNKNQTKINRYAQDNIKEVKDNQRTSVVAVRQPLEVEHYKS
jgi:hypothetical protein